MLTSHIGRAALLFGSVTAIALPAAASASTDGSVTVSLTKPAVVTASHTAPVACSVDGSTYRATLETTVRDYAFSVSDVISNYDGANSYSSTARVTVRYIPTGAVHTAVRSVNVDINDSGESSTVPFDVTLTGARAPRLAGRSVAGSISWSCEA